MGVGVTHCSGSSGLRGLILEVCTGTSQAACPSQCLALSMQCTRRGTCTGGREGAGGGARLCGVGVAGHTCRLVALIFRTANGEPPLYSIPFE